MEWRRRLWHMSPGLLPFCLWAVPHQDPLSPTLQVIMAVLAVTIAGMIYLRYRHIERDEDRGRAPAVLGYVLSVFGMLIAFPAHVQLGLATLAVLAFGDGSATLGGLLIGGPKLSWNSGKTWSGLLCFLIVGGLATSVVYWGETWFNVESSEYRKVPFGRALMCGGTAAVVSAIVESVPSRINDNIRVGIAASACLIAMHAVTGGF